MCIYRPGAVTGVDEFDPLLVAHRDRRRRDQLVAAGDLDVQQLIGLSHGTGLVRHDGDQILVVDLLLAVGQFQEAVIDLVDLLLGELIAEFAETVQQGVTARPRRKQDKTVELAIGFDLV